MQRQRKNILRLRTRIFRLLKLSHSNRSSARPLVFNRFAHSSNASVGTCLFFRLSNLLIDFFRHNNEIKNKKCYRDITENALVLRELYAVFIITTVGTPYDKI